MDPAVQAPAADREDVPEEEMGGQVRTYSHAPVRNSFVVIVYAGLVRAIAPSGRLIGAVSRRALKLVGVNADHIATLARIVLECGPG